LVKITVKPQYASGAIVNKKGPSAGADDLVVENFKAMVNQVMNDRKIDAVVVRIASPGG
jgi:ClpP class serine protease